MRVLKHVTEDIIGINLIHKQHLHYDPVNHEVLFSANQNYSVILIMTEEFMPALTKKIIKVKYHGTTNQDQVHVANIYLDESKLIQGGPALVKIDENKLCYIEVANCAPYDMYLPRGSIIRMVEKENKDHLQKMDGKIVDEFISQISTAKNSKPPPGFDKPSMTREEIEKRANLNVPAEYREKYIEILMKYSKCISTDKNDLGRASDFFNQIHLKDKAPVYRKQFQIPESHTDFVENTLEE